MKRKQASRGSRAVTGASNAPRVFLDSGIFIALFDRSDSFHDAAKELFQGPTPRWVTSLAVVGETQGWFLHRLGETAARSFLLSLGDFRGLKLLAMDEAHHGATLAKLEKLRGHRLTYVDGASLAFLEKLEIGVVWGTDHHLALEGARVLP